MAVTWLLIRLGLGVFFLLVGGRKAVRFSAFVKAVAAYRLVPDRWAGSVALVVVALECLCGAMLILGVQSKAASMLGIALLLCFSLAISVNLIRGNRTLDCGCMKFGSKKSAIRLRHVFRNLMIAGMFAAFIAFGAPSSETANPIQHQLAISLSIVFSTLLMTIVLLHATSAHLIVQRKM